MNIIIYKSWESIVHELGGITWEIGNPLPDNPYVFCGAEHYDILFRQILESDKEISPFILVSAASDAGPDYNTRHPYQDILRYVNMDGALNPSLEYHDYICRARLEKTRCLKSDKFCNRMYCWTSSTFPKIPKCIHQWYCTNCNIEDPRIIKIPFGVGPDSVDQLNRTREQFDIGSKESKTYRKDRVLSTWSNSTNERAYIKASLDQSIFDIEPCEPSKFFGKLATYKFCLCPEGNGLDSYRILESLYMGCIPIIVTNNENSTWVDAYCRVCPGIPVCNRSNIGNCVKYLIETGFTLEPTDFLYLEPWKALIQNG